MTRRIVFAVPDRDTEVLVTLPEHGAPTVSFRPKYGSWGKAFEPIADEEDRPNIVDRALIEARKAGLL